MERPFFSTVQEKMKMCKHRTLAIVSTVAVIGITSSASAATTFNGGALDDAGNWSNGLPSASNLGTIATDGWWDSPQGGNELAGWEVVQSSGHISMDDAQRNGQFTGGSWTLHGGSFGVGSTAGRNLIFADGQLFTMTGGAIEGSVVVFGNNSGGETTAGSDTGVANLSGGTVIGDAGGNGLIRIRGGYTVNLSGSVDIVANGWEQAHGDQNNGDGLLDFASDWAGSITLGDPAGFENAVADVDGIVTVDGNAATMGDFVFVDNGDNTVITLVPEPASMAFVGLGTLVMLGSRRRRS